MTKNAAATTWVSRLVVATLTVALVWTEAPPAASATVILVPGDYPTIRAAVEAAADGDRIIVRPGTYAGTVDFGGKNVTVESAQGPAATIIDGNGAVGVVMGPFGELSGFTVTDGAASFGAGLEVLSVGSRIRGNVFDANRQGAGGFGAAIGGNGASPLIDGNLFRNNSCDSQHLSGVIGFVNSSSPTVVNNVFENNPCRGINLTLPSGNRPVVVNNTLVNNRVGMRVNALIQTRDQVFRNNVLVGNGVGLEVEFGGASTAPTWENNLVFGNGVDYQGIATQTGQAGNVSVDPLFVGPVGDYRLQPSSPAIDAGSATGAPLVDHDGNARPWDGDGDGVPVHDIGAYEAGSPPGPFLSVLDATGAEGSSATVQVTLSSPASVPVFVDMTTANGTATSPNDYAGSARRLRFDPGVVSQSVAFQLAADGMDEPPETFSILLSAPTGAQVIRRLATVTILDTDLPPSLSVAGLQVVEGNAAERDVVFNVSLSVPSGFLVEASATVSHDTTSDADVVAGSQRLRLLPGTTSVGVAVRVRPDSLPEGPERFVVTLRDLSNATAGEVVAVGTIIDDDSSAPVITSGGTATFTVGRPGSFLLTAGGVPGPVLAVTGTLPRGVSFDASTGVLGGSAAPGTGGSYLITFTATNPFYPAASQPFTLVVLEAPAITSGATGRFTTGRPGALSVEAIGTPRPSLHMSGSLPAGLAFDAADGLLRGTPGPGSRGTYRLTIVASNGVAPDAVQTLVLHVDKGPGYWLAASDGGIFAFGDAAFRGSTGAFGLKKPVVGMSVTPTGDGYWLVSSDGGIFAFGDAVFRGSTGGLALTRPVVGMAATPTGTGYWLVSSDGGVASFGDAGLHGSVRITLTRPIVGMVATPSGAGYWLVSSDGGVFAFGDAVFLGSTGAGALNRPIVGMVATPTGRGYWLVAGDGGVFAFGDARFLGSTGALRLNRPIVGMVVTPGGTGYYLVADDGGVFAFGDAPFLGSTGALRLNQPIVAMATLAGDLPARDALR